MYNIGQICCQISIKVLEREKGESRSLQAVVRMKRIDELSGKWLKSVVQPSLFLRISHHFLLPAVKTTHKKEYFTMPNTCN
jgi:hypothetical protein